MRSKIFIGVLIAIVLVGIIFFSRIGNSGGQKNVYAVLPLTGASSELGKTIKQAMDLYFGMNPKSSVNIVYVDSGSSPEKAATALSQKIVNEDNPLVVTALSSVSAAVIPIVNQKSGFTFAILTSKVEKNDVNKSYLRFDVAVADIVTPNVKYMKAEKIDSASILFTNDEYGLTTANEYKKQLHGMNASIVKMAPFSLTDLNVREVVSRILSDNPKAIVVCGNATPSYINVFKELQAQRYSGIIFADLGFTNPFVYKSVGDICRHVVVSCTRAVLTNKIGEGKQYMLECMRSGIPCNQTTVAPYDVLSMIEGLLKRGESLSDKLFLNMEHYQGVSDTIKFIGDGECSYDCLSARVIDDYSIVPITSQER